MLMKIFFSNLVRVSCSPLCQRGIMIGTCTEYLEPHNAEPKLVFVVCQSVSVEFPCPVSVGLGVDVPF